MGKKYTTAQKRATEKHLSKLVSISIRVKPAEKEKYAKAAKKAGMALRAFMLTSMEEKIERDSLK